MVFALARILFMLMYVSVRRVLLMNVFMYPRIMYQRIQVHRLHRLEFRGL